MSKRKPNSSDRLKKTQIAMYVEPEQMTELKELSAQTGVPMQVYLRRGLTQILELEWQRVRRADGKGNVHTARVKKESTR
jgi:hypothetical protein